jgi:TRAP transporter 4TM/12TM fusion protein
MTTPEVSPSPVQAAEAAFDETGVKRDLTGAAWKLVAGVALAFSTYQLLIAAFSPLSSLVTRSLHVGFLLLLAYLIHPISASADRRRIAWYDAACAALAFALACYHWVFEADLIQRSGDPTTADLAVGTLTVVLLFEAARRVLGPALPIICAAFLAYGLFGQYLPSAIAHRGYGFDQIVGALYLGTEGIYGIPTLVSATYIFLFILFGSFLEHAGMIGLFNNIALGFVGHARGGPAKVAVISSGMMGTISGSGVANVLTVGQFTIPLMKRFGYSPIFAGAVEATSSMGGQIMPPVMGAVAFIMAETLNVPYVTIVKAAVIPAMLYYATAFWMVHLEAGRAGLTGLPKADCPNPWEAIRLKWYLMLPLAVLVFMLFDGFTPMFAGIVGLALTAVLILGVGIASGFGSTLFRVVFWVVLGFGTASFFKYGIWPIIAMISTLVAINLAIKGGRATLAIMRCC